MTSAYDEVASAYEERFASELDSKPRDRDQLSAFASAVAGRAVLEVGCGPGQIGSFVRGLGVRVIGADLSPAMARLATARLDAVVVADMRALPFRPDAFGGVIAFYCVIHIGRDELGAVFGEFARVGSRVLVTAHEGEGERVVDEFLGKPLSTTATVTYYRLAELVDACGPAELSVVSAERREPYEDEGSTVRLCVEAVRR